MKINDKIEGALLGASIALIAGQLGPQVALPEEIITVPTLTTIGFIIGKNRISRLFKL